MVEVELTGEGLAELQAEAKRRNLRLQELFDQVVIPGLVEKLR